MGLKNDKPSLIPARAFCFSEGTSEKTKIYKGHSIGIILFCQEFLFFRGRALRALPLRTLSQPFPGVCMLSGLRPLIKDRRLRIQGAAMKATPCPPQPGEPVDRFPPRQGRGPPPPNGGHRGSLHLRSPLCPSRGKPSHWAIGQAGPGIKGSEATPRPQTQEPLRVPPSQERRAPFPTGVYGAATLALYEDSAFNPVPRTFVKAPPVMGTRWIAHLGLRERR